MDSTLTEQTAGGLSTFGLVLDASLTVQMVMLALFLASAVSLYYIGVKHRVLREESGLADQFEDEFWSGGSMEQLNDNWSRRGHQVSGMAGIFMSGYKELNRIVRAEGSNESAMDAVHRAMRVELGREIDHLEAHLSFLATVGSTSPYVGLFGTVWGIMNSFLALGISDQQATIATVAPGIAEALIATAMGLFAAIPAVIAYNRFSHLVERLVGRYELFIEEFLSIVNRQARSK
ncbi:MAG: protein TolQ [Arenicellaceae bacterium]|nr:protein TolQ [Arenicellaceae bacterium]